MPQLVLYNSLSKREELFVPREQGRVKIFTCGPSVYQRQHLGNYRTYVFEDILQKYLEYLGYKADRAINYTDMEDKTIERARKENISIAEITEPNIDEFEKTASELGIYLPPFIPRSTTSVEEAVDIIKILLDNGTAYRHGGNIYFDPLKYPRFGEIYGLDMSKWPKKKVRFSRDTYQGHRWNLGDFILWHGAGNDTGGGSAASGTGARGRPEAPVWDTEIGRGRPSWNVQDSAVIRKTLGSEIDIHMGGIDNIYRHHDYNRAVMEMQSGSTLASYWVHCEHLIVAGEKMSKSKGNTLYPDDAYARGCTPKEIRFMLLSDHYRERLNITEDRIENCCETFHKLRETVRSVTAEGEAADTPFEGKDDGARPLAEEVPVLFKTKMNDNLKVPEAVSALHRLVDEISSTRKKSGLTEGTRLYLRKELKRIDGVLGILFD
jgi:cysteinyl-tRNA synthetase